MSIGSGPNFSSSNLKILTSPPSEQRSSTVIPSHSCSASPFTYCINLGPYFSFGMVLGSAATMSCARRFHSRYMAGWEPSKTSSSCFSSPTLFMAESASHHYGPRSATTERLRSQWRGNRPFPASASRAPLRSVEHTCSYSSFAQASVNA